MKDYDLFLYSHTLILEWETERFTNYKNDLGGPTKYGITLVALSTYRGRKCTADDVKNLTKEEALKIYYQNFWIANGCHRLPPALALLLFDGCVNQSASAIRKYMQIAIGVKADGVIGPATALAAGKTDVVQVVKEFMALRAVRYSGSKTIKIHGLGWFRRMFDMTTHALDLV